MIKMIKIINLIILVFDQSCVAIHSMLLEY